MAQPWSALPEGIRQIIAGLLSSVVFLGVFLGLGLEWFVALGLGLLAYVAVLLIIPRRRPLSEIVLTDRVTAEDIAAGQAVLTQGANRLARAATRADAETEPALTAIAADLRAIAAQIADDPEDFRASRRFIVSYLPKLVDNVENYVALSTKASGPARDRLAPLRDGILAYRPVVSRIAEAGLENDFRALESEIDALGFQLKRG